MLPKIHLLPEIVINRIAAGEVIERPASIVRELLENALDAQATRISIHATQDGHSLHIGDNGGGMDKDTLQICTQRHTTSKLPEGIDGSDILKHIHHFGFRGEALASIAAVSRLSIISRTKNDDGNEEGGFQLKARFGKKPTLEPSAAQIGTLVRVDDLFHDLPARRKFLKSGRYELSLIADVVKRLALSHPKVSFELSGTSARPILYPAAHDRTERIKQIIGTTFLENATPIETEYRAMSLAGLASLPTYHRPNTNEQFVFVNGRPVRDRVLAGAVRAAYADLIFRNRHAALLLFLDLPQNEVDVNVHPAKAEVRFRDAAAVRLMVIGAIKGAMKKAGHKTATPHSEKALDALEQARDLAAVPPPPHFDSSHEPQDLNIQQPPPAEIYREHMPKERNITPATPIRSATPSSDKTPLGVARGQLHKTYIVSQTEDAIVITDQHAAHERILHERLKAAYQNKNIQRHSLLVPEIVDLTREQIELLMDNEDDLARLGFVLARYGANSLTVSDIPVLCKNADIADILRTLADDFTQEGGGSSFEEMLDRISGNIACHSAIRAGQTLSFAEMDALLRRMATTPNSGQCNHGRPTYIELKLNEVEKLFHRR